MFIPISLSNSSNDSKDSKDNKTITYIIPQSIMPSYYEYQDINKDAKLRIDVINFFFYRLLNWVKHDSLFSKYKKYELSLDNKKTKRKLYKILRKFVKKSNINWYEIRSNYSYFKDYLYKHFKLLL